MITFTYPERSIGGSGCFYYDWENLEKVDISLLKAIDDHRPSLDLTVDCYVHTLNANKRLDKLSSDLHALQHIRIFVVETKDFMQPLLTLETEVIIATYAFLSRNKCGRRVSQLDICQRSSLLWKVWAQGLGLAIMQLLESGRNKELRELWDIEQQTMLSREIYMWEGFPTQPEWGVTEGW